ncbi:MAG: hypothetical protein LBL82_05925 [Oscillospiraceae bacterium]|nr:hypothetical protein [Oscillospiraceae bacterium]
MGRTIREIYKMDYDKSSFESSLVSWYNKFIDKTPKDLDVFDVSRMLRQNILRELAIKKAVHIFNDDPYVGEMYECDLLKRLVGCLPEVRGFRQKKLLRNAVKRALANYEEYDWQSVEDKNAFFHNLNTVKDYLKK